jgi:transcriptional regulator with XRE-family HTH domain
METMATGRIDGRKVQQLRLSRRLTQKQLGTEADVSNETVNKIERAREPKSVNLLTAYKIAGALGVDARELLED